MPEHHVILNEREGRLVFCLCHERGTSVGTFTVGKAEEIPTTALRFAPSAKGETRGCRKERRMLRLQSGQRTDDVLSDQSLLGLASAQAGLKLATFFRLTAMSNGTRQLLRRNTTMI